MPDEWIRKWGDPTLRQVARPIVRMDDLLRRQIARMQQRLIEAEGAGLAATQVGLLRRVFVFRWAPDDPVDAILNPRVLDRSAERATFIEGCLSSNAVAILTLDRATPGERRRAISALLEHERDARPLAA